MSGTNNNNNNNNNNKGPAREFKPLPMKTLAELGKAYKALNNDRAKQPYQAGIFFDNDKGHRQDVSMGCHHFTTPTVFESPSWSSFGMLIDTREGSPYSEFIASLSPQAKDAALVVQKLILREGGTKENYDIRSGIQEDQIQELQTWLEEHENKRLAAVFDFDRTLSVMEGGFFYGNSIEEWKDGYSQLEEPQLDKDGNPITVSGKPLYVYVHRSYDKGGKYQERRIPIPQGEEVNPFITKFTYEGYLEYLVGGPERLVMLQEMFDKLYDNHVDCFILTNNTACPNARGMFQAFGSILTRGRPITIICGIDFGGRKDFAMKGKATNTGPLAHLRTLCMTRGGRRRGKNKKTKKHRKQ
jgi:hypothetical protein